VVAAVVVIESVEVCAVVPLRVTEVGDRLQVAGSLAAVGLMEQVRATAPENPAVPGVTVITEVLPEAAPGATLIPLTLESAKVGAATAFTVTFTVVVCVMGPEIPVTVMT
jgi:hypothetical protein